MTSPLARTCPPTDVLDTDRLLTALSVRDLSDPATGPHALQSLIAVAVDALATRWGCAVDLRRPSPLVAVEDNYDRLGYRRSAIARDSRYTRYVSDTVMLRSHTSAGVPPTLRAMAADPAPPADVLVVLPGLTYRRDVVDRLHVGTPHQVDLWRIVRGPRMSVADLGDMVAALVEAVLPGARRRGEPAEHPYTTDGLQIDVHTDDGWVELAECGLAAPHVLAVAGLDPDRYSGLALGMGLDRALMLRKGVPDIRMLRASDPRIAEQMLDLAPWRPVSALPTIRRDLSLVVDQGTDEELLGDRTRAALGADAEVLESLSVLAQTPHEQLPSAARERLGTRPGQSNVLLRLTLRPIDRTLTDREANAVRARVYAALHVGPHREWAANH
jgi:phenylalanyl-tRNA synthetase alpha chain